MLTSARRSLEPLEKRYDETIRSRDCGNWHSGDGGRDAGARRRLECRGAVHDVPVCPVWVWQHVRLATRLIVGHACNPNSLRKTAAVYFADHVGAGILNRVGWEAQQAFAYTWTTREIVEPAHGVRQ